MTFFLLWRHFLLKFILVIFIYFWNLHINAKLKEKNEKKYDMTLNISKNLKTVFDHWFDLIKAHN